MHAPWGVRVTGSVSVCVHVSVCVCVSVRGGDSPKHSPTVTEEEGLIF